MTRIETFPQMIRDLVTKLEGERRVTVVLANGHEYLSFARAQVDWLELYDDSPVGRSDPPDSYVSLEAIVAIEVEPREDDEPAPEHD